jgi:hypothetical protein
MGLEQLFPDLLSMVGRSKPQANLNRSATWFWITQRQTKKGGNGIILKTRVFPDSNTAFFIKIGGNV